MSEVAAVVLAHADPEHFSRLAEALEGVPMFLHCDAKAPLGVLDRMATQRDVHLLPRRDTRLSGWSLVAAELSGVEAALRSTSAGHIIVMSGADYPLLSVADLVEEIRRWEGRSFIYNRPIPFALWSTPRHPDGGAWRTRYRFVQWRDNLVTVAGRPLRVPLPRARPYGLELRASSQWKVYSRSDALLLLRVLDARPDLIAFGRTTFVPDESFVASVLASAAIVGSQALPVCYGNPWFYRFPPGGDHPRWLEAGDLADLAASRWAAPFDFAAPAAEPEVPPHHRKLFARKFSSRRSARLLDIIDRQLR